METIKLDFCETRGNIKYMNAVNNGPIPPGVRDSYTNFYTYKEAGISYARNHDASHCISYGGEFTVDVHRIFRDFSADENDPNSYIFEPTDKYLLNIQNAGTKVFYRLGAAIEHRYKYGTYPPESFEKWARICEHIIMHYNEGWANGFEMNIEYWEIWNEPDCNNPDGSNPCWQGTEQEFNDFYICASTYLKNRFPNLKFGGPAFMSIWSKCVDTFLKQVSEKNAALDFLSFHIYSKNIENFEDSIKEAKRLTDKHGLNQTELILNEWNYVKGWTGDEWKYTLKAEKSIKGASFISSVMCVSQYLPLDMLMYYDARPCTMNGMFEHETYKPLKGYYPFLMFKELLGLGKYIETDYHLNDIYSCAATDTENHAIMLSYFNDDDNSPEKDVVLWCSNAKSAIKASCYLLDENNDMTLVKEEIFNSNEFKLHLHMGLFTTYLVKFTKIEE